MLRVNLNFIKNIKTFFFPFYKNKDLKNIFKKLQEGYPENKITARFVGGCVRNYLSGNKIEDIDIATILSTDEMKKRFIDTNFRIIETGTKHGTVTILSKMHKIEITTLRKDLRTDGRHAEVEYIDDWKLDSERRDFTINAIYLDINGKIFDPQMGTVDLKNNNVKFIGDPQKRIVEDYLRIIRFVRFKILYDLNVEKTTSDAIKQNLDGIKKISKERILTELFKILKIKNILQINDYKNLREIFLMIFPEFLYLKRLERLNKIYDTSVIDKDFLLAVLLIDEKDNHEYFAHKYSVSNKIKEDLNKLAFDLKELKKNKDYFDKDLIKNIYLNSKNHLINLNLINFAINSKVKADECSKILKRVMRVNIPKFHIDGEYLKKKGMKEGKNLGKVLKVLEDEWLNNDFKISNDKIRDLIKTHSY